MGQFGTLGDSTSGTSFDLSVQVRFSKPKTVCVSNRLLSISPCRCRFLKVRLLCPQPQHRLSELVEKSSSCERTWFSRAHQKLLHPSRDSLSWASEEMQERQARPAPCQPCIGVSGR